MGRHDSHIPQDEGYVPSAPEGQLIYSRAENGEVVAYSCDEYGVRTDVGELHSYPADEIGFSPGRGHVQVRTWWGMGILTTVMGLLVILSLLILLGPVGQGGQPFWGALFLTALGGFGVWYTFGMTRDENQAKKLRKARHAPEPGAGYRSR